MSEEYYDALRKDPVYVSRTGRAKSNKAPSRSTSMGTIAQVRYPGGKNRSELQSGISEQDQDLVAGHFGNLFWPTKKFPSVSIHQKPLKKHWDI